MTTATARIRTARSARAALGWGILLLVGAALIADGIWLLGTVAGPAVFEQDTGVPMSEAFAVYPTVVDVANLRGIGIGVLVVGLGLAVLVQAGFGLRSGARAAWAGVAAVFAPVAAVAVLMVAAGAGAVGYVWTGYAALLLFGLALSAGGNRAG